MHEYILYSQIAAGRHDQVLNILAGVTATQPLEVSEQVLIYQQTKSLDRPGGGKKTTNKTQTQDLTFHKLIRGIKCATDWKGGPDGWRLRKEDVPEPGVEHWISRAVEEREVRDEELSRFRRPSEYFKLTSEHITTGSRFTHNDILIRLTRTLISTQPLNGTDALDALPPARETCQLVDRSGAYVVEACVRVDDGTNANLRARATEELMKFARMLEGAVDLRVVDRLALDTRVRGV